MKILNKKSSLKTELSLLCITSFCIAFAFYTLVSQFSMYIIQNYYNTEKRIELLENKYKKQLQNYITENKITFKNLTLIDDWVMERDDIFLKLFLDGNLIYDTMYGVTDYTDTPIESTAHYSEMNVHRLEFQNTSVDALLFCYDFTIEGYAKTCVLILSGMLFFFLLLSHVKKKIMYLIKLNNELNKLSENLKYPISVKGSDEIAQMAKGIDHLRLSIIEKLDNEKRAYNANMHLITSLSHDIKTPLTSVIAYIELARQKVKSDIELIKYLDISLEKSLRLKSLTNDLFGHFLLHSNNYEVTYETVNGNELIVQMLEENLFDLEAKGVCVKRNISDITCRLNVNISLLHRLFDNLVFKYL